MGLSSGEQGQAETPGTTAPAKQGLSFSVGKKKSANVVQFGLKSKPAKSTAAAFAESSSEEEEEMPEEYTRVSFENEQLTSTPTQQQDTLEKVIEYADTLKIKAALRPKLLIRFVKGKEQGGILPGTIPKCDEVEPEEETSHIPRKFKERKEIKHENKEKDSKESGNRERDSKDRKNKERLKDCKDVKDSSDRGNGSERTRDRRDDKYKQSKDYDEKKESRHRKHGKYDSKESRDVDESRDGRKSSSKKRDSNEGKRGFRWEDSTKTKQERT